MRLTNAALTVFSRIFVKRRPRPHRGQRQEAGGRRQRQEAEAGGRTRQSQRPPPAALPPHAGHRPGPRVTTRGAAPRQLSHRRHQPTARPPWGLQLHRRRVRHPGSRKQSRRRQRRRRRTRTGGAPSAHRTGRGTPTRPSNGPARSPGTASGSASAARRRPRSQASGTASSATARSRSQTSARTWAVKSNPFGKFAAAVPRSSRGSAST